MVSHKYSKHIAYVSRQIEPAENDGELRFKEKYAFIRFYAKYMPKRHLNNIVVQEIAEYIATHICFGRFFL